MNQRKQSSLQDKIDGVLAKARYMPSSLTDAELEVRIWLHANKERSNLTCLHFSIKLGKLWVVLDFLK